MVFLLMVSCVSCYVSGREGISSGWHGQPCYISDTKNNGRVTLPPSPDSLARPPQISTNTIYEWQRSLAERRFQKRSAELEVLNGPPIVSKFGNTRPQYLVLRLGIRIRIWGKPKRHSWNFEQVHGPVKRNNKSSEPGIQTNS